MGQQVAQSTDKARAGMARMGAQTGIVASGFTRILGVSNPMVASLASVESGAVAAAMGMSGMTGAAGGLGRALTAMLGPLGLVFAAVTVAVAIWEKFTAAQKESEKQAEKEQEALAKVADQAKKIARSMKEAGEVVFRLPSIPSVEEEARQARIEEFRVKKLSELLKGLGPSADVAAIAAASREAQRFAERRFEIEEKRAKQSQEDKRKDLEITKKQIELRKELAKQAERPEAARGELEGAQAREAAVKRLIKAERERAKTEADSRAAQKAYEATRAGSGVGLQELLDRYQALSRSVQLLNSRFAAAGTAAGINVAGIPIDPAARSAFFAKLSTDTAAGVQRALQAAEEVGAMPKVPAGLPHLSILEERERVLERELGITKEIWTIEKGGVMTAHERLEALNEEEKEVKRLLQLQEARFGEKGFGGKEEIEERLNEMDELVKRLKEIDQLRIVNLFGPAAPKKRESFPDKLEWVEENLLRDTRNKLMTIGLSLQDAEEGALQKKAQQEARINDLMKQGIDLESARKIAAEQSLETFTRFNVTMEEGVGALANWVAGFGTAEAAARGLGGYIGTEFLNVMGAGVQAAFRQAIGSSVQFTHANKESQRQAKAMELTAGQAFKAAARDAIVAVAAQASVKAIFATAEGIFAAAHGNAPAAAGFFAAAHMYASIAGVATLAAQMIGPVRKTIPDTGAGAGGGFSTDRPTPEGGGPQEINITVNVAPGSSPEDVGRAIVQQIQAFERDQNRRVLVN